MPSRGGEKLPTGSYIIAVAFAYAPVRFVMDFFRITEGDVRGPPLRRAHVRAILLHRALRLSVVVMLYVVRENQKKGFDPQTLVLETRELDEAADETAASHT